MASDSGHLKLPTFATASRARLQALYSDIARQKASNPAAFQANIEWWRKTLESFVSQGLQANSPDRLVLHASRSLVDTLKVDGVGKPLGLHTVVTELLSPAPNASPALPSLIPKSAFFSLSQSLYTSSSILTTLPSLIASYLIAKPLWWALEQMGIVGQDGLFATGDDSSRATKWQGEYVVLRLVERAADQVIAQHDAQSTGPGDALYTVDMFRHQFATCLGLPNGTSMSRGDADVLLKYLARDKKRLVAEKEVLKFVALKDAGTASISAVDKGIVELKTAVTSMHAQVESLQAKVDGLTQRAADALKQKRKPLALNCIRTRKQVQDLLEKRLGALENLESTLLRVEAAAGDVEIMASYAQSTATLKMILSDPALQRDSIDATMEALADAHADAKDIDEAIRDGAELAGGETYDDSELEAELQNLLREREEEETQSKLDKIAAASPPVRSPPQEAEEPAASEKIAMAE